MSMTDPVADMLTRIRNANRAKLEEVSMPSSKLKVNIVKILKDEGFISNYKVLKDNLQGTLKIYLKYDSQKESIIFGIKRISKPGLRVYVDKDNIPKVMNGLGVAILSTSKGVLTDRAARKEGVGGEVLCSVW
ncbi:MAG: 30S ribosomal protein S8 [Thermodesulfobacteriota bacterium]